MWEPAKAGGLRARSASAAWWTVASLACLAPWAFGAVQDWAVFLLDVGIVVAALFGLAAARGPAGSTPPTRWRFAPPGLALAGLAALALSQSSTAPAGLLKALAPGSVALRGLFAPGGEAAERVAGDEGIPVGRPRATLGVDPEAAVNAAARLAAAWVLFQTVAGLGGAASALPRFGKALAANAALLAVFALVQALSWNGKIYWLVDSPMSHRWFSGGPFVSHNHLAAYLNLGLGFALAGVLAAGPGRRGDRVWAGYVACVLVAGVLASHSRSGFLGMLAGLLALGAAFLPVRSAAAARKVGLGLAAASALVAAVLVVGGVSSTLPRLATLFTSGAYADRLEIWEGATRAWRNSPWLGTGLGSFQVATAPFYTHDRGVMYARAENEYVDLLTEGGLLGLALGLSLAASVGWLAVRAVRAAQTTRERAALGGALFGLAALAVQALGDFCLHVPAIAVPALVLGAYVTRLGLDARRPRTAEAPTDTGPAAESAPATGASGRWGPLLAASAALAVGVASASRDARLAAAEAKLGSSAASALGPRATLEKLGPTLETQRAALESALRVRPDWAEGHVRLGTVLLELYQRTAASWVAETETDPNRVAMVSDPLWLLSVARGSGPNGPVSAADLVAQEPVRDYLVPAARSFLQARRCSPMVAASHARLGGLSFLLEGGDPAPAYLERALALAGPQSSVLDLVAQAAVHVDDVDLAARAWRRWLAADPAAWEDVAEQSGSVLAPEQILKDVLTPDAASAVRFAERLYPGPGQDGPRGLFLREALARLKDDGETEEVDRLDLEARSYAGLGERAKAVKVMEEAIEIDPLRRDLRKRLVLWAVDWGDWPVAREHALAALRIGPEDVDLRWAVDQAAEGMARGEPPPGEQAGGGR